MTPLLFKTMFVLIKPITCISQTNTIITKCSLIMFDQNSLWRHLFLNRLSVVSIHKIRLLETYVWYVLFVLPSGGNEYWYLYWLYARATYEICDSRNVIKYMKLLWGYFENILKYDNEMVSYVWCSNCNFVQNIPYFKISNDGFK